MRAEEHAGDAFHRDRGRPDDVANASICDLDEELEWWIRAKDVGDDVRLDAV